MSIRYRFTISFLFLCSSPSFVWAQQTHVERLQEAGVSCVADLLNDIDAIMLAADTRAPYIRTAIVDAWLRTDRRVFTPDSLSLQGDVPVFSYQIEEAGIELADAGSNQVERTAKLSMRYVLSGPSAQILADNLCEKRLVDSVDERVVNSLADARYPQTNVEFESRSWLRKYLEPVVVIGAAVVGTYLFFNLRSKRSNDG